MRTACICLCLIVISFPFAQVVAATYYASPQGDSDGTSLDTPFTVSRFWERARPDDTLVLTDGVYTGTEAMINPASVSAKR